LPGPLNGLEAPLLSSYNARIFPRAVTQVSHWVGLAASLVARYTPAAGSLCFPLKAGNICDDGMLLLLLQSKRRYGDAAVVQRYSMPPYWRLANVYFRRIIKALLKRAELSDEVG